MTAVDILWRIDNIAGMCSSQAAIRDGMNRFAAAIADIDFHIAVTTTHMTENSVQMLAREQARSRSVRRQYNIEEDDFEDLDSSYDRMGRTVRSRPARSPEARQMQMQMEASEEILDVLQLF